MKKESINSSISFCKVLPELMLVYLVIKYLQLEPLHVSKALTVREFRILGEDAEAEVVSTRVGNEVLQLVCYDVAVASNFLKLNAVVEFMLAAFF